MSTTLLHLLHEGDAYEISVEEVSEKMIQIVSLVRFDSNQSGEGSMVRFYDLDSQSRSAVIRQINRRFVGRTVKI
jgi:hypothetical protein